MGKNKPPLPYFFYLFPVIAICLLGLVTALYLIVSHYRVYTDLDYSSFCAISQSINCDTVSQSPYSILLGLPVPLWGVIGYLLILLMILFCLRNGKRRERIWSLVFWVAAGFSLFSLVLALISTFLIEAYCILCILTYGVNFALAWFAWLIRNRFSGVGLWQDTIGDFKHLWANKTVTASLAGTIGLAVLLLYLLLPDYWDYRPPVHSAQISNGITADGHPWLGAENPQVVIEMYSDYQCFQCRKVHFFLRQLMARHPDAVRLISRHFPMDHEFNPLLDKPFYVGSGKLALLAIYAASEGKFFEMNELLFEIAGSREQIDIDWLAQETGLNAEKMRRALQDPAIRQQLTHDIRQGIELPILGTPSFVIDNQVYTGHLPAEVLKNFIDK